MVREEFEECLDSGVDPLECELGFDACAGYDEPAILPVP